jgi:GxxExxY protein
MNENELSQIIIGKAIEVHSVKEKPIPLIYEGIELDCGYRIDILVEDIVVIEIKSIELLTQIHLAQILTYLRIGHYKLGLLINFNVVLLKDGIRRVVNGL